MSLRFSTFFLFAASNSCFLASSHFSFLSFFFNFESGITVLTSSPTSNQRTAGRDSLILSGTTRVEFSRDRPYTKRQKKKNRLYQDFEPDVNRTRNLLIWSQTRYHCATDPLDFTCKYT
ncbi:hypothetical protein V6Z11_D09G127300 [Gossypium hirsutum]